MDNELRFLTPEEAESLTASLQNYRPSDEAIQQFATSNFGIIAGATGAGKDTLRNELIESQGGLYQPVLSTTTRPPRELETEGVDYHFKSLEFIEKGLRERRFLQAAVIHNQQVSCLDYVDIEDIGVGQIGLGIIVVEVALELRAINSSLKTVFITTPDLRTLISRATTDRTMSNEELHRRLHAARTEFSIALEHPEFLCIINDDIDRAASIAHAFFKDGVFDNEENQNARAAIQGILNELSKY